MKNKKFKKIIALLMLISSISVTPFNVLALTKEETVYAKLNENGSANKITVNEHLINSEGLEQIEDYTELKDILNINGDEKYKKDGDNIVWNTKNKDIFYEGSTNKELPVKIAIKYYLNDKETTVSKMLDKKGKVKIVLNYTNLESHTVNINGLNETMYTPFTVIMGTIIDSNNNSNVSITNGKIISSGINDIAVALAAPGLNDSLKIGNIPQLNTITITYDTKKFELPTIYNVVSSKMISEIDLTMFDGLKGLTDSVKLLQGNMDKIESGASTLNDSLGKLNIKYSEFNNAIGTLNQNSYLLSRGMNELTNGANAVLNNQYVKSFRSFLPVLADDARTLSEIGNDYFNNANSYLDTTNEMIDEITNDVLNTLEMVESLENYLTNNSELQNILNTYGTNASTYVDMASNYLTEIRTLTDSINSLNDFSMASARFIISTYEAGPETASDELRALYEAAQVISNSESITSMLESISTMQSGLANMQTELNTLSERLKMIEESNSFNISDVMTHIEEIKAMGISITNLKNKISEISSFMKNDVLNDQNKINEMLEIINALPQKIDEISKGIDQFEMGINTLNDGSTKLSDGINIINNKSNQINAGLNELYNGSNTLAEGITTYNKEGINKLSTAINGTIMPLEARINALSNLGKIYETFGSKKATDSGETKFVLILDGKSAPKKETKKEKITEKVTLWKRIKDLFS